MSYSREYNETIIVTGSKAIEVSYPASQNGGSKWVTIDFREDVPVNVNIHVDTENFEKSIKSCNTDVDLLTGSVAATNAAQVTAIKKNSQKVASTVVSGFFGYIRSEISQQVSELAKSIEAQLMHLKELSQSCLSKKKQMEVDYQRISSRYHKIFDDLNHELSNRIHELDKSTFSFRKEIDNHKSRQSDRDLVSIVSISSRECGSVQNQITTSFTKKRAFDTLIQAKAFLLSQKKLDHTIKKSMLNESTESYQYLPICYLQATADHNQSGDMIYTPGWLPSFQNNKFRDNLLKCFQNDISTWHLVSDFQIAQIKSCLNEEVNRAYGDTNEHTRRIKEITRKLTRLDSIQTTDI